MNDQIKDLIYSIAAGNADEIQTNLETIMSQKAVEAIDSKRVEVAKSMFSGEE